MKLLETILVNVNLENSSDDQLEAAVKLATKFNSKIILLCVLPKEAKLDSVKNYIISHVDDQLKKISEGLSEVLPILRTNPGHFLIDFKL